MTINKVLSLNIEPVVTPMPRIMLVGDYVWPWYHEACANALESLGCEVDRFGWFSDFRKWVTESSEPIYHSLWHKLQMRYQTGPIVWKVEKRLLQRVNEFQPDIIWFYNVHLISPSIVLAMKHALPNVTLVQYANDNPFSPLARPGLWRNFLKSIPLFDVHFSFRLANIADFQQYGARSVYLLRSYLIPEAEYPVPQDEIPDRFKCDVVFAGHFEDDGRIEMLEAICDAGFKLNLFGGGWSAGLSSLRPNSPLRDKYPIKPAIGRDYQNAICGAKVALCFLSKLNQDTYTQRSFQIPAMKVAMLSQYTDDLATLFTPDTEAIFFSDKRELIEKLDKLLKDDAWRVSVANAGYSKVYKSEHDVTSRMRQFLKNIFN